jgi:Fe-S cluster biosynthesis and repair protein YggX
LELVRRHAISMAWRQSEINIRSVEYFTTLKEEQEMLDFVLKGSPNEYRKNLFNNIAEFRLAWENEVKAESSVRINEC